MTDVATRSLDAGGPFPVWAPAGTSEARACGHGVYVELPLDPTTVEVANEVTLLLRRADQSGATSVRAHGDPVAVRMSLATGQCSPRDDAARRFLAGLPWLAGELALHLDLLRERAARAVAQRDRSSCDAALAGRTDDRMLGYDELFPADWDLLVPHGPQAYLVVDQHCPKAACPCKAIVLQLYRIDDGSTEYAGKLTVDLRSSARHPEATTPVARALFDKIWRRYGDQLERRHAEVRAAVHRTSATVPAEQRATVSGPSRNGPCPCGSGKKYKRCCADSNTARRGVR
jgi:hypothetical protein